MKFSSPGLLAGLLAIVAAEDLLFDSNFESSEYSEATTTLGYTAKVVSEADWRTMTTTDFASYKAVILSDPGCLGNASTLDFLNATKAIWSPAIQGNIILLGTDPSFHAAAGQPGATALIDSAISFAASGTTATGTPQTGLYLSLSCYYDSAATTATVTALSAFGDFAVRGNLACSDAAHIVATSPIVAASPALAALDDEALLGWACSVHEAFAAYPSDFQAVAIARDVGGEGEQAFADGSVGVPYIVARGMASGGCGDGGVSPEVGGECDGGNGGPGDGCAESYGTCLPLPVSGSSTSSSSSSLSSYSYSPASSPPPSPASSSASSLASSSTSSPASLSTSSPASSTSSPASSTSSPSSSSSSSSSWSSSPSPPPCPPSEPSTPYPNPTTTPPTVATPTKASTSISTPSSNFHPPPSTPTLPKEPSIPPTNRPPYTPLLRAATSSVIETQTGWSTTHPPTPPSGTAMPPRPTTTLFTAGAPAVVGVRRGAVAVAGLVGIMGVAVLAL